MLKSLLTMTSLEVLSCPQPVPMVIVDALVGEQTPILAVVLHHQLESALLVEHLLVPVKRVLGLALPRFIVAEPLPNFGDSSGTLPLVVREVADGALLGLSDLDRQHLHVKLALVDQAHTPEDHVVADGHGGLESFLG